ncbi:bactofilin family protein [Methyloligella halotolerans]|nr:polymer-forming cytoskeletal protein [Methyloligella halotolerans]
MPSASSYSGKAVPSIIGEDLTIVGNVTSKGEIQVDGEIQGDVHCVSLLLGEKSRVIGGVVADDVVVRGSVSGSISGMRVTLQAQSHVEGDIYHQSLSIEQGAYFEGKSRRVEDPVKEARQSRETGKPAAEPAKTATGFGSAFGANTTSSASTPADSDDDALTLSDDASDEKAKAAE